MSEPQTYTGTDESGLQWLVTVGPTWTRVATRRDSRDAWSRPVVCQPEDAGVTV